MSNRRNLRQAYGHALVQLGRNNPDIVVLEADLGKSTQSVTFQQEFPERYFQMGIAEQNMTATAAGLALVNKVPFVHSFAVFASGRAYDQIRNSICIPNLPVRICGSSAGLSDFGDGKTHQSVEDMALMRAIPNMTVLCPCDAVEVEKAMACLSYAAGPVYIRINRNDLPVVYPGDERYHLGKVTRLRDGTDVVVFACGVMTSIALGAAEMLLEEGISVRVVNVGTLKPLEQHSIAAEAAGMSGIVTAEEHSIIGGLGSAIAEALRSVRHGKIEFVGIKDRFGVSARNYEDLLEHFGLTSEAIADAVRRTLQP